MCGAALDAVGKCARVDDIVVGFLYAVCVLACVCVISLEMNGARSELDLTDVHNTSNNTFMCINYVLYLYMRFRCAQRNGQSHLNTVLCVVY